MQHLPTSGVCLVIVLLVCVTVSADIRTAEYGSIAVEMPVQRRESVIEFILSFPFNLFFLFFPIIVYNFIGEEKRCHTRFCAEWGVLFCLIFWTERGQVSISYSAIDFTILVEHRAHQIATVNFILAKEMMPYSKKEEKKMKSSVHRTFIITSREEDKSTPNRIGRCSFYSNDN